MWDDLLRVAASALVVGKLCSSKRQQNALAAAIKEYGALRRTVSAARYLADETDRRRIGRQLNKGENLHALKRSLAYAGEGRSPDGEAHRGGATARTWQGRRRRRVRLTVVRQPTAPAEFVLQSVGYLKESSRKRALTS